MDNKLWIASFDIGKKNFSVYIEEIDIKLLSTIKNISLSDRYNLDGTPTEKMNKILLEIYKNGTTIFHKNYDLTQNCEKKYLDKETYHNMIYVLDSLLSYFDKCSYFIVEEQMFFKGKNNKMAVKLGQHCQSYFYFKYGHFKEVIEFHAYYKTNILGAQKINNGVTKKGKIKYKNIDKPARKKWAIQKATEILTLRNEQSLILEKKRGVKKDDLADTLIQLQAFKYLFFIDKKKL